MTKIFAIAALAATAGLSQAAIITQWNFNSVPPDTLATTGTTTPVVGAGSVALFGGTTTTFASGVGSSDTTATDNSGYGVTTFQANPTAGAVSPIETRGVRFNVSTTTFDSIIVNFDWRTSNTGSDLLRAEYSVDGGTTWVATAPLFDSAGGDTWNNNRTLDLSAIAGVNNNAGFAVRFVAAVDPVTGRYRAANPTSTYGTAGTWRFDNVTVNGTLIPSPGAIALVGLGGLVAGRRRRA